MIRHEFNDAEIAKLVAGRGSAVARNLWRRGQRVRTGAIRRCPANHGRLRASIHVAFLEVGGATGVEVGTDVQYALWVHQGTGIYGPHHARIVPTHGSVLAYRSGADMIIVRSVRGQRGVPFLRDALEAARGA